MSAIDLLFPDNVKICLKKERKSKKNNMRSLEKKSIIENYLQCESGI